jgi:hypothetical protein
MNAIINWLFKSRIGEQQALARAIRTLEEVQRSRPDIEWKKFR